MKKKAIGIALSSCLLLSSVPAYADGLSNSAPNPNQVISIKEEVTIPGNVTLASDNVLQASSISYDHNSGIDWDKGRRQVWGNTQAKQGSVKLNSYTRARYERSWIQGGGSYGDSGRVWSSNKGRSYARSDWEKYDTLNSGVAKTYYGI
ncbi:hypothetical protein M3629_21030 [Paenibacillus polysaccharolyticus]|uniref:hypothetical protein n=1 Tax=Paenibacillus polysaccharolyticus TaxID=582692 RepID=UPI00203CD52F|nr:hypothetical protein [Paenibacillus polysaccharolyticus]MCM3135270.1 hypothetical protein [Paenibacillus polysaccharolyticus]